MLSLTLAVTVKPAGLLSGMTALAAAETPCVLTQLDRVPAMD
jgi:hypothetical protein